MNRVFNFTIAVLLLLPLFPLILLLGLLVRLSSPGPAIHWSSRVGKDKVLFKMPKFRTMRLDTPDVATHLLKDPDRYITPIGRFLRKTSLDELPQLWSVLKGDMVFVGPRPALFNQDDLMALREQYGIHRQIPGITGWAQIQGRDELSIPDKVELERYYLEHRSFWFDLKILLLTIGAITRRKGVSH